MGFFPSASLKYYEDVLKLETGAIWILTFQRLTKAIYEADKPGSGMQIRVLTLTIVPKDHYSTQHLCFS